MNTIEKLTTQATALRVVIGHIDHDSELRKDLESILDFLKAEGQKIIKDEQPKTLRQINDSLYGVLCDMLATRKGWDEHGQIEYKQNDLDWMEETYAYIKIRYYLEDPDGSREEFEHEEFVKEGSLQLTDEEAYYDLTARLNNTRI